MPQVIPFIPTLLAEAGVITATTATFLTIVSSIAVGLYERDRARAKARAAYNASLQDRITTVRSGIEPVRYALGTIRTGGVLLYADSVGENKVGFDAVTALAGNVCELVGYYIGEDYIDATEFPGSKYGRTIYEDASESFTVDGPTAQVTLSGIPANGTIIKGGWRKGKAYGSLTATFEDSLVTITDLPAQTGILIEVDYKRSISDKLRAQFKTGTSTQTVTDWDGYDAPMWTAEHRARGICHARTLYIWDENLYANGAPSVSAILKGGAIEGYPFYDPRTGTNPTYTDNPAILWGWWRTLPRRYGGMGTPSSWIDWASVGIAANICDELITVKTLDGSSYETVKRYQCHTILSTGNTAAENEQTILGSMAGRKAFTGGLYRVVAGAFRTAALTITDDNIVGTKPISVITADPSRNPPNTVTARIADATANYVEMPPPPVVNDTYVSDDGHEEPLDIVLAASTDPRQANYLMGVELELGRPSFGVKLSVDGIGENIALLDTVQLDITNRPAYSGRTYEVLGCVDNWDGTFDLTLSEIKASTYALDPDKFNAVATASAPDNSYLWNIPALTNFTATPQTPTLLPDGTSISRVDLSWDTPPGDYISEGGHIEIRYRKIGGEWIGVPSVPGDATATTITAALVDSDIYQFQARAVSSLGAVGPWADSWQDVIGTPLPNAKFILLRASSTVFHVPASGSGVVEPSSITLTIDRQGGLTEAASWTTTPTATLGGSADVRTLAYNDMPGDTCQIDVEVDEDGSLYLASLTISKLRDGADAPDYIPDTTPPPTPTGLTATAAFAHIILEWDPPAYSEGHGPGSTEVYGKLIASGDPQPTFADADLLGGTPSSVYSHAAGMGETWAFWIKNKSVDDVLSTNPAGGTNGVQATTGKIGNTDLGAAIVEASNLADGSVSAAKLASAAVDSTKFASGIEPVIVVTSLPSPSGYVGPKTLLLTTNGKLYRYTGGAWVTSVSTADITGDFPADRLSGQITGTQISDGAVSTPKLAAGSVVASTIAAGAVRVDKLLVSVPGAALNPDPNFADSSAWQRIAASTGTFVSLSDGAVGKTALRSAVGASSEYAGAQVIPVDPQKVYRVHAWIRRSSDSNGRAYIGIAVQDANGDNITGNGTYWYVGAVGATPGTIWTEYVGAIGPGHALALPSTAKTFAPMIFLNYLGTSGYMEAQDLRVEEVMPGTLIRDGAISTDHLDANSVTASKIAAGAVSTSQLAAYAVTSSKVLVTGRGAALNDDPAGIDIAAWSISPGTLAANIPNSNAPGGTVLRASTAGSYALVTSRYFPVTPGKTYRVSCYARQVSGSGAFYLRLWQLDASGTQVGYDVGVENITLTSSLVRYSGQIVASSGATQAAIRIWSSYPSGPGVVDLADIRCEEAVPGDLIVDGAITADHLSAGSIAGGSAAIANGAISNAMIANLAVDSAKLANASIVNAKLADASITGAKIQDASITGAKIGTAAIGTANIADAAISSAKIGDLQVDSAKIANLTIGTGKITDNAISGSGSLIQGADINLNVEGGQTLLSFNYTSQGGKLLILANADLYGAVGPAAFAMEIRVDGTTYNRGVVPILYSDNPLLGYVSGVPSDGFFGHYVGIAVLIPAGGSHVISMWGRIFAGTACIVTEGRLFVMEFRK